MRAWCLVVLAAAAVAPADDWQRVADRDGVVVESRVVPGSPMHELRVTAHSPLPPGAIMDTLWKPQEYPEFITYLKRVDVLRDDGDTRLLYEQIRVPVVRDRDVTVRATRTSPAENEWEMRTVSDPGGPPESKEYVRIRKMESHWRLVADGDGTAVTYGVRTDAGGGWVPAWLLNAAQRDVTVKLVRAMLDRALEKHR